MTSREIQISPKFLYKYIGNLEHGRQIIQTSSLYMSSATEFNDPFDLNIQPIVDIGDERMEKYSIKLYASNEEIRSKISPQQIAEYIEKKEYASKEGKSRLLQGAMMGILSHGVCCFTTHECDLKFWALYANDYSGICLRYEPNYKHSPFKQSADVKYGKTYPLVGIDEDNKYEQLFLYKHQDWQGENEWRIVLPGSAKSRINFQPPELSAIICGYNMKPRDIERIKSWIILSKSAEYYRPKLFVSSARTDALGLQYTEIEPYG